MGRTATFDRDDVVRAARDVFWARGYAETGVAELEAATGLKRSSLYHAFGSKKGLFEAVVARYLDEVVRSRIGRLQRSDAGPDALEHYVAEMRRAIASGTPRAQAGCLLLNAACAPVVDDDPDVRALVTAYTDELRAAIAAGVDSARPEISAASRAALSEVCASLVIAALAVARVDPDAADRSLGVVLTAVASWDVGLTPVYT
ncbi:TetR/AcrR family transcriptional regulator [Microbacterium sp. KSW4-11]|uniref:TetR/AcrR family transcriptional regulator n=1 Tax=Microbacterium gawkjiense TaxID=3067309 RepID=A0ABU3G9V0_9MICO|nr:TetR/AcrR family transcriptional regulator [Microbacterium sp. KSW4-11]MDT3316579.1 TetR/AcrR family transcriptional regulator [Microbacterium sp. KSW4-11]